MPPRNQLVFERPIYELEDRLADLEQKDDPSPETRAEIRDLRLEITQKRREIFANLDAWQITQVARHPERPQTLDYLELIFDEFVELHGDRAFRDDPSILTGFVTLDSLKVLFVGQHKGRDIKEQKKHNYGMAHPEGYRKALGKMQMAAKFGLPIVCFIDTKGAYPGIEAEQRGQAYAIAINLREISKLKTPIICVVIGEGGSGGALGIGIGDHIAMLQYSYYSVISPEGCAGILWKHVEFREEAAKALKFTSDNLLRLGVVDEVIPEPLGAAHRDHRQMAMTLKASLVEAIRGLTELPTDELLDRRYEKFRRLGIFDESVISDSGSDSGSDPDSGPGS